METVTEAFTLPSPEEFFEIKREVRLELARRYALEKSVLRWGRVIFPEKFFKPPCVGFHDYLVGIRGEEITSTKAPRWHAKTAIAGFLIPTYESMYEPENFQYYLLVQGTEKKALDLSRSIKFEYETSEILRQLYWEKYGKDPVGDRWTDSQFELSNSVVFGAISTGQSIRGIQYAQRRPDKLIIDDIYDEPDINSPESTEKKNDWIWSSLYPARANAKRSSVHFLGTAINDHDVLNKNEKDPTIKSRTFRAITDWDKHEVLWPEVKSFDSLMVDKSRMGTHIFMRELQNEPRDEALSIVKPSWIKDYDPDRLVFDGSYQYCGCVLGVDPSIGEKSENDFTGIVRMLKGKFADSRLHDYYIEWVWNEHISLNERVMLLQKINDLQATNRKVTLAYLEGISGFKDFVAEVRRRTNLPVREVDQVKDKITTLENKSHFFENGRVYLSTKIPQAMRDQLLYQLTTNHPKFDDLRDALLLPLEQGHVEALGYI